MIFHISQRKPMLQYSLEVPQILVKTAMHISIKDNPFQ